MTESENSETDLTGSIDTDDRVDTTDAAQKATAEGTDPSHASRSSSEDPLLIYDGDCTYCSMAAVALKRIESIDAVGWEADAVGPFLDAQFDARPFAMLLVDPGEDRVYAGRSAAEELAERAGTPGIVGSLVRDNYDAIAETVGLLSGRERDPADVHDTYELTEAAREHLPALREAATEGPADVVDASDAVDADA